MTETKINHGGINVAGLVAALQQHALGENEMSSTQVGAAIALLKKVLPDLPGSAAAALGENADALRAHEEALRELE